MKFILQEHTKFILNESDNPEVDKLRTALSKGLSNTQHIIIETSDITTLKQQLNTWAVTKQQELVFIDGRTPDTNLFLDKTKVDKKHEDNLQAKKLKLQQKDTVIVFTNIENISSQIKANISRLLTQKTLPDSAKCNFSFATIITSDTTKLNGFNINADEIQFSKTIDTNSTTGAENKPLELLFQEVLSLAQKQPKLFSSTNWDFKNIKSPQYKGTLHKFIDGTKHPVNGAKYPTAELLWQAYYLWIWNNNENILQIKTILQNELLKLGWTASDNPFISYLKIILAEKKFVFTSGAYAAIHNLKATGKLTTDHLTNGNKLSLIYCPALLKESDGNIVYRHIQTSENLITNEKTIKSLKDIEKDTGVDYITLVEKLLSFCFIKQPKGEQNIDNLNWETFKDFLQVPCMSFKITASELREERDINKIIIAMGGAVSKVQPKQTISSDNEAQRFWDMITNSNIGTDKKKIEAFFNFLLLSVVETTEEYTELAEHISKEFLGTQKSILNGLEDNLISNITMMNKIIKSFDITSLNIGSIIKLVVKQDNIPETLRIAKSDAGAADPKDTSK